jgi:hypothetical protein
MVLIPIPIITTKTVSIAERDRTKLVTCEECKRDYYYTMFAQAELEDPKEVGYDREAKRRSAIKTEATLQQILENEQVLAPCPNCGRVQKEMFAHARVQQPAPLLITGALVALFGVVLLQTTFCFSFEIEPGDGDPVGLMMRGIFGCLIALGVSLSLWGWIRRLRYDPNSEPLAKRLEIARHISVPAETYQELLRLLDAPGGGPSKKTVSPDTGIMPAEGGSGKPKSDGIQEKPST